MKAGDFVRPIIESAKFISGQHGTPTGLTGRIEREPLVIVKSLSSVFDCRTMANNVI